MALHPSVVKMMHKIIYNVLLQVLEHMYNSDFERAERDVRRVLRYVTSLQINESIEDPEIEFNELQDEKGGGV